MSGTNNIYQGHKVVAMPTGNWEGFTYNEKKGDDGSASPYHSRYRSRSNGRTPVSRSRDIVQDVYDRMGVNYIRGQSSIDALIEQSKTLADTHKGKSDDTTNSAPTMNKRHSEFGTQGSVKSGSIAPDDTSNHQRSIQRGRLTRQWPPTATNDNEEKGSSHSVISHQSKNNPTATKERNDRMSMPSSKIGIRQHQTDKRDEAGREIDIHAPDDERDGISVLSFKSNKSSVRDMVGMYSSNVKGSRASVRHSYSGSAGKRNFPPKVNIYDSGSLNGERPKERTDGSVDCSQAIEQSSCIAGTRNVPSSSNSVSRSVADAYLSSISKPSNQAFSPRGFGRNISVVEIPTNELHGHDNVSVAASSVSGEDFLPSSSPSKRHGNKTHIGKTIGGNGDVATKESMEKIIEDRVQSQIAYVTRKFESEIRRVENRIDRECKTRLEELEKKTQSLTRLVSHGGHSA